MVNQFSPWREAFPSGAGSRWLVWVVLLGVTGFLVGILAMGVDGQRGVPTERVELLLFGRKLFVTTGPQGTFDGASRLWTVALPLASAGFGGVTGAFVSWLLSRRRVGDRPHVTP